MEYIACQGPLEATVVDFWDMIIQYNVEKIVMLTRPEEQNPHNPSQTIVIIILRKISNIFYNILVKMLPLFSSN